MQEDPDIIREMGQLLVGKTSMFIDYANVRPWSEKLGWHISIRRLKQFLDSFENIGEVNFYSGTLEGDERSEKEIQETRQWGYTVRTKPVKIMRLSVNASSLVDMADVSFVGIEKCKAKGRTLAGPPSSRVSDPKIIPIV